ncbi:hypothetical protein J2T55_001704 [Methylohalomonas lacus]|uniref:Sn-glycerol-3-phosphate transporter n=2 Tax=Methylohalomonas lacus TaxID=398773 RepID=A0AAE3HJY8_9GAMM|nr:hypothetical protein [Methylohalomonas lacus]MCS3903675.1 hypothetical protein [Methylohalomonas lacus]
MNRILRTGNARGSSIILLVILATMLLPTSSSAFTPLELDHVVVQTSLYTKHFDPDPDHNNDQNLINVEFHNPERWLVGGAWFKNSYDQPSWYVFVGREFPLWQPHEHFELRAKLTGGFLHGYDGEHQDDIPFNSTGTAPVILPSLGARIGPVESDVVLFGTAGLMVTTGLRF